MIRSMITASLLLGLGFAACTNQDKPNSQIEKLDTTQIKNDMKNLVSIVEIPSNDFLRAVTFYQTMLDIKIEKVDMDGVTMGVFPSDSKTVNVVLVNGGNYKPSSNGTVVYLNAGDDLQVVLDKVEKNGGKVTLPKTEISPEMGFFAMFTDTEGNTLGLHSAH